MFTVVPRLPVDLPTQTIQIEQFVRIVAYLMIDQYLSGFDQCATVGARAEALLLQDFVDG